MFKWGARFGGLTSPGGRQGKPRNPASSGACLTLPGLVYQAVDILNSFAALGLTIPVGDGYKTSLGEFPAGSLDGLLSDPYPAG